jgi:hypothetical protein
MNQEIHQGLREISVPSTDIRDVIFEDGQGGVRLRFTFWREDELIEEGIRFDRVRAHRHRAESHCTVWHIDAYDTLVEVRDSEWVAELREAMPEDMRGLFEMHHYMIYLDSEGCYEVVAKSWEFLPETVIAGERK